MQRLLINTALMTVAALALCHCEGDTIPRVGSTPRNNQDTGSTTQPTDVGDTAGADTGLPTDTANVPTGDTDGDTWPQDTGFPPSDTDAYIPPVDTGEPVPVSKCGNGKLTQDEACDDGNNTDGDGCRGDCLLVEDGYSCNPPGKPCHLMSKCGNGMVVSPELCDDGNMERGDGCNDLCMVEIGFKCAGSPSVCTPTICGDNIVEGAEGCDDGNALPFDGCDGQCQIEPDCEGGGSCTSKCGDGLVINEGCDDGNNLDGDGCSADCTEEDGYDCLQPGTDGMLEVPVIYKDFNADHPDFEPGATGCDVVTEGMVQNTLGPNGKPVAGTGTPQGCGTLNNLADWYDHSGGGPAIIVSTLKLYDNGNGGFVNRWSDDGTPWNAYTDEEWCADQACGACNCADVCIDPCTWGSNACCATPLYFDGDPFFFPLDGLGITPRAAYATANIGPTYGYEAWPDEDEAVDIANLEPPVGYSFDHNFHFTSEVRFWFQYDQGAPQVLNFVGDDDVWVFIENKLAVDLGGIHTPQEGEVNINRLGLTDGEVYEIVVFQAERQTAGSTYRLTLSGFNTSRSECRPECGDGVIGIGEECDDGVNDGGYGECAPGCVLGEYCGDNIIQEEYEDCDDGNFFSDDDCPASCRNIIIV